MRHYAHLLGVTDLNLYAVTSANDKNIVLDAINQCLGVAQHEKKRLLCRQALNPLYYFVIAVGYLLRIPFLILQQAGMPESVESTVWAQGIKVVMLLVLLGISTYFGIKGASLSELFDFIK